MKYNPEKMATKKLEAKIKLHNKLYFLENAPEISDYDFDRLVEELKKRKPDSKILKELISDITPEAKKVSHKTPMLSLDKCYDEKNLNDWANKFEGDIIASPKIDGMAVSLKYDKNGILFEGSTRGDGEQGEDITQNVLNVASIPNTISKGPLEVRGEIYMPLSVFKEYGNKFANPRNLAAGAIKLKDPKGTKNYRLSFFAYDAIGDDLRFENEKYEQLKNLGFSIVDYVKCNKTNMQSVYENFLKKRDNFNFELDGVVFRTNDLSEQKRLGSTAHHPRYAIAYKFQGDSGTTSLLDVEWSVSRTGAITPIAIVEPVMLSGAMVKRTTLHNLGIMQKHSLTRGAKVVMMRRGGVIPHLESVLKSGKEHFKIPKHCPSCGGDVEERDDILYCKNPKTCIKSKIGELEHFVKVVGIDGLGTKLIEKLYEEGLVTDVSEFYDLTVEDLLNLERMGDTLASKLITNINSARKISLADFLRSLGIRELGKHVAKVLSGFENLKKITSLNEEELSEIETIGPVIAKEVVKGLQNRSMLITKLLKNVSIIKPIVKESTWAHAGNNFLFTGKLIHMSREEAQKTVEDKGGNSASSVSKTLDFLVVGDDGGAGSKLNKAKELQKKGHKIQIISEKEFLEMLD